MPVDSEKNPDGLNELDAKIRSLRKNVARESLNNKDGALPPSLAGVAARAGVELVAGVAVGAGMGYGLDVWLGSSPWMLIVCFILGSAAGMMNVYRAVNGMGMALGYTSKNSETDQNKSK
jgi:ATP synthase protein I